MLKIITRFNVFLPFSDIINAQRSINKAISGEEVVNVLCTTGGMQYTAPRFPEEIENKLCEASSRLRSNHNLKVSFEVNEKGEYINPVILTEGPF